MFNEMSYFTNSSIRDLIEQTKNPENVGLTETRWMNSIESGKV